VVEEGVRRVSPEVRTAAITVVLGFVVFVLGQIAQKFFIEPIQEQKRIIGEIASAVLYYGNVSSMARPEIQLEAYASLRKLAGQLRATLWSIPCYRLFEFLRMVEKRENVLTASAQLVGWANSVHTKDGGAPLRTSAIVKALRLPQP